METINSNKNRESNKSQKTKQIKFESKPLLVPRFDPTKLECTKYERCLNTDESVDFETVEEDRSKTNESCYYQVERNLKNLFENQTSEFKISSLLDSNCDDIETRIENETFEKDLNNYDSYRHRGLDSKTKSTFPTEQTRTKESRPQNPSKFFIDLEDNRLIDQEPFYSEELVAKICKDSEQRRLRMIRTLSLRKKFAIKNIKTEEKYKKRLHKKFIPNSKHRYPNRFKVYSK
ncbi:glutathione S-transferase kappa 1-like [Sarcoptes scabiei]|nr:glutathione S-transferase kappa 1-like [Sarcoptes scabiei]